jgi:hypothetical protein
VAVGYQALKETKNGYNVAVGYQALLSDISGRYNVATGFQALNSNISGDFNVAVGSGALYDNINGNNNVATGTSALSKINGNNNVATGYQALHNNINGNNNVAIGYKAGYDLTDGSDNIFIGKNVHSATATNQIVIGVGADGQGDNTACIGNTDISCVYFGSTSGNAKLDCGGIVIGSQGITLEGSFNIPAGPGDFGDISFDGNCGRIDMSGSLTGNTSAFMTMYNSTIKASSLVFASIIAEDSFDQLVKSCYIIDGGCQFWISNPTPVTFTTPSGPVPERIQFMVINPST